MGFFGRLRALGGSKNRTARDWYESSVQLAAQKKTAEAHAALKQALQGGPETHELFAMIGFALEELGDLETAIRAHRSACDLAPSWAQARLRLGRALLAHGQIDAALCALKEAVSLSDYAAEPCLRYAQVLEAKGEHEEALSHYHIAVRAAPENLEALRGLGRLQRERGHIFGAVRTWRCVLERSPSDIPAMSALGNMLSEQGRHQEAIEILRKVRAACPNTSEAHGDLALALSRSGAHPAALEAIQAACTLVPSSAAMLLNLGTVQHAAGQTDLAIETYRQVVELEPGLARAHLHLGVTLEAQGARDAARVAFETAERLAPGDPIVALAKVDLRDSWERQIDEAWVEPPPSAPPISWAEAAGPAVISEPPLDALSSVSPEAERPLSSDAVLGKAWTPLPVPLEAPAHPSDGEEAFDDGSEDITQPALKMPEPRPEGHPMLMPLAHNVFASAPPIEERPPPSRSITGELGVFPLPEVLEFLAERRSTGILSVSSSDGSGEVWLNDGRVTAASSPNVKDIISIALELGAERRAAVDPRSPLVEESAEDRGPSQPSALEAGALTQASTVQIEGALRELVTWTQGSFAFRLEPPERVSGVLSLEARAILDVVTTHAQAEGSTDEHTAE